MLHVAIGIEDEAREAAAHADVARQPDQLANDVGRGDVLTPVVIEPALVGNRRGQRRRRDVGGVLTGDQPTATLAIGGTDD